MRFLIAGCLCMLFACGQQKLNQEDKEKMFEKMRVAMVEDQIASRDIKDEQVLNALRKVPRHMFVPEHLKKYAYADEGNSPGFGRLFRGSAEEY